MSNIMCEILNVLGLSENWEETEHQIVKAKNKKNRINDELCLNNYEYDKYKTYCTDSNIVPSTKKKNRYIENIHYLRTERNKLIDNISYLRSKAIRLMREEVSLDTIIEITNKEQYPVDDISRLTLMRLIQKQSKDKKISQDQSYIPITNDSNIRTSTSIEYPDLVDIDQVRLRKRNLL